MFDLYRWPIIGPMMRGCCEDHGEDLAGGLWRRGWSPEKILRHANEGISESAAARDTARMHEFIGMGRAARRMRGDDT